MSEKVLGFLEKDATRQGFKGSEFSEYGIDKDKLVPVVSVEEHERIVNEEREKYTRIIEKISNKQIETAVRKEAGKK